jgi:hypothetical protein
VASASAFLRVAAVGFFDSIETCSLPLEASTCAGLKGS